MLVLTRRVNESIVIGDEIVVTVLEVKRDSIRIGIKTPHNIDVNREEIQLLLSDKLKDPSDIAAEASAEAAAKHDLFTIHEALVEQSV